VRVVLTGGGGFIGSYVLARLVGAGIDVTLLGPNTGRSRYTASLVDAGDVEFVRCAETFYEEDLLRTVFANADVLVMLGYAMPKSSTFSQRLLDECARNVEPTVRLLRASEDHVRHVVFASSASVYGVPARTPVWEADTPRPTTPYAVAKLACEHAIRILCETSGRSSGLLRYSTAYGPGELVPRAIPNFIRAALQRQRPHLHGDGLDVHDYIHVTDVADATLAAIQRGSHGVYNVGTGVGISTLDLANLVFGLAGETATPVFDESREPARTRVRIVCDTELARAQLGFTARRSLPEGILDEIGWFRTRLSEAAAPARARRSTRAAQVATPTASGDVSPAPAGPVMTPSLLAR
jgi:UDP-glucose 4-epimerase